MLPQGQGQIFPIYDATLAGRVRKSSHLFGRILEFHDCYVRKFLPPDNMRYILPVIVGEDFANVNQL